MSEELNEAVSKARQKSENLTTRIKVGFHFVVIGLLLLLVTLNWNAAETTNNLSKVIERREGSVPAKATYCKIHKECRVFC